jgi:hypothetical protein
MPFGWSGGGKLMKTVAEYRVFAKICRELASKLADPKDKQALDLMARAWENVADQREANLIAQIEQRSGSSAIPEVLPSFATARLL